MPLPTKQELGEKLLEYPLIRQLLFERWFRLAFAAFVLVFVFLGLFLPKIWRTSQADFTPVIKVSGLDLVQAWSLRRTAVKQAAAGKFEEANYAWQAALANNRADPALVRGALGSMLQDPHRRQYANQAIQEAFWLLRLTQTNLVDVELAARVLQSYDYYEPIVSLAGPRLDQCSQNLLAIYLKALFDLGQAQAFDARWRELQKRLPNDPALRVYRAAYLVGWGPPETIGTARAELNAASEDPVLRSLATRLKLAVSGKEMSAENYAQALKQLEDWHEDTLKQHAIYWRLLNGTGRKSEALQLLQQYSQPPSSAVEVAELAQSYSDLGLRDQALQLLQRYTKDYAHAGIFWICYAGILTEAKRWEDLRNLAIQMRSEDALRDQLAALSYFLEGRAELGLGRTENAKAAFTRAVEREIPSPSFGLRTASQLLDFGFPELARTLLLRLENSFQHDFTFWVLLFRASDQLKDVDNLVKSASNAYLLNPNDRVLANNYAAALIITRQKPEEAIRLTLPLISDNPSSVHAVINHSAALLLNGRPKEAEALLNTIATNRLTASQWTLYNLDRFETCLTLHDYDCARSLSDTIDVQYLYPSQRRWLDDARRQLPPRQKDG
jgi:predicted Zn-dependent protease